MVRKAQINGPKRAIFSATVLRARQCIYLFVHSLCAACVPARMPVRTSMHAGMREVYRHIDRQNG